MKISSFTVEDKDPSRVDIRFVVPVPDSAPILMFVPIVGKTKAEQLDRLGDVLTVLRDSVEDIYKAFDEWDGRSQDYHDVEQKAKVSQIERDIRLVQALTQKLAALNAGK